MARPTPLLALLLLVVPAARAAQSGTPPALGQRVDRIERELRAVQRKVFPGSAQAPGYLEPELTAPAAPAVGLPAAAPLADLTARVASLEQELARLTGQVEQNGFKLRQIEEQTARLRTETDDRLRALEGGAPAAAATARPPVGATARPTTTAPRTDESTDATEPAAPAAAAPPASSDPAEDAYLTGYRAWAAKDYPAAEAALKDFAAKYPKHKRASFAQNLLGRTYLDSGRPAAAALAFHKNYTGNPRGERAPDSLYYLGQALMKLDKPNPAKACEAYAALDRDYGDKIGADLKAKVAKGQSDAKCAK